MVVRGWIRRTKLSSAWVSGSLPALGPDQFDVPFPASRQRRGKLRLRSTPCALVRRSAAVPSGFTVRIVHRSTAAGNACVRNRFTTRSPARSSPCMLPMTSSVRVAPGCQRCTATIGRPCTDVPITIFSHRAARPRRAAWPGRRRRHGQQSGQQQRRQAGELYGARSPHHRALLRRRRPIAAACLSGQPGRLPSRDRRSAGRPCA